MSVEDFEMDADALIMVEDKVSADKVAAAIAARNFEIKTGTGISVIISELVPPDEVWIVNPSRLNKVTFEI